MTVINSGVLDDQTINNKGQVLFNNTTGLAGNGISVLSLSSGTTTSVPTLVAPPYQSWGVAINDQGQVAGYSVLYDQSKNLYQPQSFVTSNGTVTSLGNLPGGRWNEATAMNNQGQVVGYVAFGANSGSLAPTTTHAYLYSNGSMKDLGTLGGSNSQASGINDAGQIVGNSTNAQGALQAFLYQKGSMQDLGTLGGVNSQAMAINNAGQIVGMANTSQPGKWLWFNDETTTQSQIAHAFLYQNGQMIDLNSVIPAGLGWTLISANLINNLGQIVGLGLAADGTDHYFLLTPSNLPQPPDPNSIASVPEPSTLAFSFLVIAALAIRGRTSRASEQWQQRYLWK